MQTANANLGNAKATVEGTEEEFEEKEELVQAAKERAEQLSKETRCAKDDLANTKQAVVKASEAAREATLNANKNKRRQVFTRQAVKQRNPQNFEIFYENN